MGIFDWVRSLTGAWGPALLEIYFDNAAWINTLVLVYGALLVLAWGNLSRILDDLVDQVVEQAGRMPSGSSGDGRSKPVTLDDFRLSWERAFAASRFPFIARQSGVWVRRSTLENARALISERDLYQRCARGLKRLGLRLEMRG